MFHSHHASFLLTLRWKCIRARISQASKGRYASPLFKCQTEVFLWPWLHAGAAPLLHQSSAAFTVPCNANVVFSLALLILCCSVNIEWICLWIWMCYKMRCFRRGSCSALTTSFVKIMNEMYSHWSQLPPIFFLSPNSLYSSAVFPSPDGNAMYYKLTSYITTRWIMSLLHLPL